MTDSRDPAMRFRLVFSLALLAFAVTLAVVVGQRLSAEAMIVMVGVVAGVAASIPTSLFVVWLASRAQGQTRTVVTPPAPAPPDEPRIIVVNAAPSPSPSAHPTGLPVYPEPARQPRRFNVIGGEEPEPDDEG